MHDDDVYQYDVKTLKVIRCLGRSMFARSMVGEVGYATGLQCKLRGVTL